MPSATSNGKAQYGHVALKYARDVIAGKIPAGLYIRQACQRHIDDLAASKSKSFDYRFDDEAGSRVVRFCGLMPHTKAEWAARGEKLKLEPWQVFFVMSVFGWLNKADGYRRYRVAFLFVPRKNGKSALAAALGLYMLVGDREHGAEVFSGATTEDQAWEVFKPARIMAQTPGFANQFDLRIGAKTLSRERDGAKFEPLIGNPGDGASPTCAIVDEYHEHKTSAMYETMETGMAARRQPLMLVVTTAGDNLAGPCYDLYLDAIQHLAGHGGNEQMFAMLYTLDKGDDWTDPAMMRKANPNYGVSVLEGYILPKQKEAARNPRKQGSFRTKHVNAWVQARDAYFDLEKYRASAKPGLKIEQFKKYPCRVGLDLASTIDVACAEITFQTGPDTYVRFGRYYLPEACIELKENEHYRTWRDEGWITETPGDMIDYGEIKADILDLVNEGYDVREIAFDPHQAHMMMQELRDEGVACIEVRQTVLAFSPGMKRMDALIREKKIVHNGDPVFEWMLSNVTAKPDAKDNVYPRKERDANKIDGPVAHIMVQARWMMPENGGMQGYIDSLAAENEAA